jgi:hypothetical protein
VAECLGTRNCFVHQRRAYATSGSGRVDGQRPKQQRRDRIALRVPAGGDMPEPDRADQGTEAVACNKRQALRRQPAAPQLFGRFALARRPHGTVEQGLTRRTVRRALVAHSKARRLRRGGKILNVENGLHLLQSLNRGGFPDRSARRIYAPGARDQIT